MSGEEELYAAAQRVLSRQADSQARLSAQQAEAAAAQAEATRELGRVLFGGLTTDGRTDAGGGDAEPEPGAEPPAAADGSEPGAG